MREITFSASGEVPTGTGVRFIQVRSTDACVQVTLNRCTGSLACGRRLYVRSVQFVLSRSKLFNQRSIMLLDEC